MIKPVIDASRISNLLFDYFGEHAELLAPIGTGQISGAYSFSVAGNDYIIRFVTDKMSESFAKDRFAFDRLASSNIVVPCIIHVGTFENLHFAISHRIPGVPLDGLSRDDYEQVAPSLIETLDSIHQTNIADTKAYGDFDGQGVGRFQSWRDYLLSVADEESDDGFYGKWHPMFDETFLSREFFDYIFDRMRAHLKFCPEERYLVHADYGFGNVLADNGKVASVLDWANAVYGDFLYDVAWLDIGDPDSDFKSRFHQYYKERNRSIPYYNERIVCYQCYISLDSQKWYGKSNQPDKHEWMRNRILSILNQNSLG